MIRVEQTFYCAHGPRFKGEQKKDHAKVQPGASYTTKSQGHTFVPEDRYCLCTGGPLLMERRVHHHDPDGGPH